MTTGHDIAARAAAAATRANMAGWCQTYAGLCWSAFFGRGTPNSYSNATAARKASQIVSRDPMAAPPGAFHWFEYGVDGHVGFALGSGLMANATGRTAGSLHHYGKNIHIHRVADYGLPYLGWSYTNGARQRIEGLTDANAPQPAANQRKVKSDATARRRSLPSTTLGTYDGNRNIPANAIVTPDGFVRSTYPGGQPNSNNCWFVFGTEYVSTSAFTNPDVAGIKDLGTLPAPKPIHKVTLVFGPDNVKVIDVVEGERVPRPGDPARDGLLFGGWALAGSAYDFTRPVTGPITVEAVWTQAPPVLHKVTLRYADGSEDVVEIADGSVLIEPSPGTFDGWEFKGWHVGGLLGAPYDFTQPILDDLVLVALWSRLEPEPEPEPEPTPQHRVIIDYADGVNAPKVLDVDAGSTIPQPSDPAKAGHRFAYWAWGSAGGPAFDFTTRINSDFTVVATYDVVDTTPPAKGSGLLGALITVGALILGAIAVALSQLGG